MSGDLRSPPVLRPLVVRITTGLPSRVSPSLPSVASYSATWSATGDQGLGSYVPSSGIRLLRSVGPPTSAYGGPGVGRSVVAGDLGPRHPVEERERRSDDRQRRRQSP